MNKNLKEFAQWYIELDPNKQEEFKKRILDEPVTDVINDIEPNITFNINDNMFSKLGVSLKDPQDITNTVTDIINELDEYINVRNKIFENSVELQILNDYKANVEDKYNLYDSALEIAISNETTKVLPVVESPLKQDFMQLVDVGLFGVEIEDKVANMLENDIEISDDFINNIFEISKEKTLNEKQNQGYDGFTLKSHDGLQL